MSAPPPNVVLARRGWIGRAALACAVASPLTILLGAVGARHGWFDLHVGFDGLAMRVAPVLAILGSALGLLALLAAAAPPHGPRGVAATALTLGLATALACGGWRAWAVRRLPVYDTATDWRDPLLFSPKLMLARGPGTNPVQSDPLIPFGRFNTALAGRPVAEVGPRLCAAARPIRLALPPPQAYARLKQAALRAGLALVSDDPAPDEHGRRRLEATATGAWFGFEDDLATRLQPAEGGTRIDLRVTSRLGLSDFGRGCRIIKRLEAALGR